MRRTHLWIVVFLFAVAVRIATLSAYPLHDTTEARYAEIARLMVTSNDWVVPQISPGVPFWAKPPLSIWATAGSLKLFGLTEFAARFPSLIFALLSVAVVYSYCRRRSTSTAAWAAGSIFLSCGVGFIGAGAVMTDAALTFAVTLSSTAFAWRQAGAGKVSSIAFFLGLALGLLAKGPLAVVLLAIPIAIWVFCYRSISWLWKFLPWIRGLGCVGLIALPWYIAAEVRSPGFINYFLLGEHFLRFIDSGWTGDLYGNAHERPIGTIWLFGLAGLMPWSAFAIGVLIYESTKSGAKRSTSDETQFLILSALSPLFFFTLAKNVLPAYVMPSIPALSILLGRWLEHRARIFAGIAAVVPLLVLSLLATGFVSESDERSQKDLLQKLAEQNTPEPVFYFRRMPYSASFYSNGQTILLQDKSNLEAALASTESGTLLVRSKYEHALGIELLSCLSLTAIDGNFSVFTIGPCRRP
ncbi:MAG: glycosyltransferase family 39 protein [Pseudomonadota bacterium]